MVQVSLAQSPAVWGAAVTLLLVEQAVILASGKEEGSDAEISLRERVDMLSRYGTLTDWLHIADTSVWLESYL